ncbi:MAG TPA: cation diffusion facilitator family transporter [Candidatus Acidoferrales bacterium]|nr:cation diffusion facilitator family transporter [Candidatus Acidoferrales bacterium]
MKSSRLGIFANLGLAIAKCTGGLLGHSFALVADGLDSVADVVSGLVVYFGLKIAAKPPDSDHPYGHGKAEPIAALIVGVSLVMAALVIVLEAIHGIRVPHPLPKPYTLVVLAGVLVVKELLFRHVGEVAEMIGSSAVKTDAWHHRSDAITSAFAFVGISIALLMHWDAADDWAALGAALIILYNAGYQIRPAIRELADIAPDPSLESRVREIAGRVKNVIGLDKCYVRKMGFSFYVDLHIVVRGDLSVRQGHGIAHQVEDEVLKGLPQVAEVLVHVEPEEELIAKADTELPR